MQISSFFVFLFFELGYTARVRDGDRTDLFSVLFEHINVEMSSKKKKKEEKRKNMFTRPSIDDKNQRHH